MQFCQPHWDQLREEVVEQGMGEWIAKDGATASAQLMDFLSKGEDTLVNYDPLMACHNMILVRTMEIFGLYAMSEQFGCPICQLNSRVNEDGSCRCPNPDCDNKEPGSLPNFETWIAGPTSCVVAAKEHMLEKGWLKV